MNSGKGDPNRSEGFDKSVDARDINVLQRSAVSQISSAVSHLPRAVAAEFVKGASMSKSTPTFGAVPNGDYSSKRSAPEGSTRGSRTGPVKDTPPGGVV